MKKLAYFHNSINNVKLSDGIDIIVRLTGHGVGDSVVGPGHCHAGLPPAVPPASGSARNGTGSVYTPALLAAGTHIIAIYKRDE